MSMFPGPGATIIRNDAGEPLGWDSPSYDEPDYDPFDGLDPWGDEDDEPEADEDCGREDFGYFGDEALCGE